ncbi:hypothetical protein HG530_005228 [Fusarium avenaceum]|nr:hypothetical protein HG530_005228 [Fusarium avenaceum]
MTRRVNITKPNDVVEQVLKVDIEQLRVTSKVGRYEGTGVSHLGKAKNVTQGVECADNGILREHLEGISQAVGGDGDDIFLGRILHDESSKGWVGHLNRVIQGFLKPVHENFRISSIFVEQGTVQVGDKSRGLYSICETLLVRRSHANEVGATFDILDLFNSQRCVVLDGLKITLVHRGSDVAQILALGDIDIQHMRLSQRARVLHHQRSAGHDETGKASVQKHSSKRSSRRSIVAQISLPLFNLAVLAMTIADKIGLSSGSIEESKKGHGNCHSSNRVLQVRILGVSRLRRDDTLGSSSTRVYKGPDLISNILLKLVVVDAEGQQSPCHMKGQGFGRRRIDLAEERRRNKDLYMCFKNIREKLVRESLGALVRLYFWGSFTQCYQDLEFANGLPLSISATISSESPGNLP